MHPRNPFDRILIAQAEGLIIVTQDARLPHYGAHYRVHVSDRLLEQHDGKMLEAIKLLDGGKIHLPCRPEDPPGRAVGAAVRTVPQGRVILESLDRLGLNE